MTFHKNSDIIDKLSGRTVYDSDPKKLLKKVKKLLKKGLTRRKRCDIIVKLSRESATANGH